MSKVIFNNRAYNTIEEASVHLRVSVKDLKHKLKKTQKAKEKYTEYLWDQWGFSDFSEPEPAQIENMIDYEKERVESILQTLDEMHVEDKEILEAEDLKISIELAICLEAIVSQMEEIVSSEEEIEKTLLRFEHDVLSKVEFPEEEEKESAGPWVKHND